MFKILLLSQILLLASPVLAESKPKSPAQKTIEVLEGICVQNSEDFTAIDRMARALGAKELDKKFGEGDPVMHKLGGKTYIFTHEGTNFIVGYAKGGGCTVASRDIDQKRLKELLLKNYKLVHRDTETDGTQIQELFEFPKKSIYSGSFISLTYGKMETGWKEGSVGFVPANATKKAH